MSNLKTNYKDAELSPSMNGKRQYELQYNEAGYTNLVDKTAYTEVGDTFGADDINATNSAVNELNQNLIELIKVEEFSKSGIAINANESLNIGVINNLVTIPSGYKIASITPSSTSNGNCIPFLRKNESSNSIELFGRNMTNYTITVTIYLRIVFVKE